MKKDIVNLYTTQGCPKCKVLKSVCEQSSHIRNKSDFRVIELDPANKEDTDIQLLLEHGITDLPVLLINNTFYNFADALDRLRVLG